MKREQFAFLIGGLAFGILIGLGSYHAVHTSPVLDASATGMAQVPSPAGPQSPTQMGGPNAEGGAPMVARVNQLKRMLQDDPENHEVLLSLGNAYYDAAMWDQAAGYYVRVAEIEPNADLLTDLGVCYRGMREFDKALAEFARATEVDPAHWQALYNTVIVAVMDVGRYDVAREALQSMQALDPRPTELDPDRMRQLRELIEHAATAEPPAGQS